MSTPIALTLTLSPDNPSNTTIFDPDNKALYTVHTTHDKETVTHVKNAEDEELASLEWHDVLPDKVTVGHKAPTSLRDWLHTSLVPFYLMDDASFKDDSGRKYKWRGNSPGHSLELFAEDDGYKEPIARSIRSLRTRNGGLQRPTQLLLTERAVQIRNVVVISFLFLEKGRRVNEKTSQNMADVMAAPPLSAVTGYDYNVRDGGVGH
ncbi:hypothetical protein BD310DRAFT_876064 [Dichomitus squalens]|uniref:DUF6593 domain-containing protein n=1 Tax=Dichomitus squalens TaxID=114155 RepID=A0A4Q9PZB3_9APHY|nr:hypothetical protein BD310DRAFT_876064 [Dichomitus squalens]